MPLPELDVEQWGYLMKLEKETSFTIKEMHAVVDALFELKESIKTRKRK
ncbi:hypothetical protein Megpolyxen_01440 [Candidatus Megaera polyxenophila]|nr:hypothetical protein Megpolyxen_01440 [Candidatus Megaera polyxenophila]